MSDYLLFYLSLIECEYVLFLIKSYIMSSLLSV